MTGVGAAALFGAGGFLAASLIAGQNVADWDAEREAAYAAGNEPGARPAGYDRATRNRVVFRNAAVVAGGVGVVGLATGIVWLATAGDSSERAVSLSISPRGIAVAGAF